MDKGKERKNKAIRLKFPKDEEKHKWLPMLLDAYYKDDAGILKELKIEEIKRGSKVACRKGCHYCCFKMEVPISQIEIIGLSWYSSEKVIGNVREKLKEQLLNHKENLHCPFLIDKICAVYPVRPLICREFFVFSLPCKPNEDVSKTRPQDIWSPSRKVCKSAAFEILPFYGITDEKEKLIAYESGFISHNSRPMHTCDWTLIYEAMTKFDPIVETLFSS